MIATEAWPKSSWTNFGCTFLWKRSEAQVCRRSWKVMGESRLRQERREGPLAQVGGVDEVADLPGEDEAPVLVDAARLKLRFVLPRPVAPEGFDGAGGEPDGPAALLRLRLTQSDTPAVSRSGERPAHPDRGTVQA